MLGHCDELDTGIQGVVQQFSQVIHAFLHVDLALLAITEVLHRMPRMGGEHQQPVLEAIHHAEIVRDRSLALM
jgi:hypothetical protein